MTYSLNCNSKNCVYNEAGVCGANSIHIAGVNAHTSQATQCETFMEKGIKNAFTSMSNMNMAGELKQFFSGTAGAMAPNIQCDAHNCKYNVNQSCSASNVLVTGSRAITSSKTCCDSFEEA